MAFPPPYFQKLKNPMVYMYHVQFAKFSHCMLFSSLLNYVLYMHSCPTCLMPYVLASPTCLELYVLECPKCLVPYVLGCPTHLVPCVLAYPRCLVPYLLA